MTRKEITERRDAIYYRVYKGGVRLGRWDEFTDEEKREMAVESYKIRKGYAAEDTVNFDDQTVEDLLTPMRTEDEGNSLWNVFNVLQEKMIKGCFSANGKNNKRRKQRAITSIKKDLSYNQRLWDYAMSFLPVAA